jgi:hypothetical protein
MFLLLGFSGLPLTQKSTGKKFLLTSNELDADQRAIDDPDTKVLAQDIKSMSRKTLMLIPFPNFIYQRFVEPLRWIFLDFSIYHFNENKEGPKALQEEKQKKNKGNAEKKMFINILCHRIGRCALYTLIVRIVGHTLFREFILT